MRNQSTSATPELPQLLAGGGLALLALTLSFAATAIMEKQAVTADAPHRGDPVRAIPARQHAVAQR